MQSTRAHYSPHQCSPPGHTTVHTNAVHQGTLLSTPMQSTRAHYCPHQCSPPGHTSPHQCSPPVYTNAVHQGTPMQSTPMQSTRTHQCTPPRHINAIHLRPSQLTNRGVGSVTSRGISRYNFFNLGEIIQNERVQPIKIEKDTLETNDL